MADFFEEFGRMVSDVASDITKKTGDTLEIQKIKSNVRSLKRANERDLADIGRMVYEKFQSGEVSDMDYVTLCEEIEKRDEEIETEEKSLCGTGILIRKVYNKGFAFNSMDSEPEKVKKASVMTTAAIGLLTIIEAFRKGHMLSKIALTFLSAGALSNTYDRVVRGKVVDYIGIKSSHKILGNITANLADIYILLGSVFAFLKKKID